MQADTYVQLFERAPAPGVDGNLLSVERRLPIHHFASLRVVDIDTPWQNDSVDVEVATWGGVVAGDLGDDGRRLSGDVTTLLVRQRLERFTFTLGRQAQLGGAARFTRFDGGTVEARPGAGVILGAYGGFTALPSWNEAPSYRLLGSPADTLARDDVAAASDTSRSEHWVAGGRAGYAYRDRVRASLSFHEQHEQGGLGRRNLGLDAWADPFRRIEARGRVLLDMDAFGLAEARLDLDGHVTDRLRLGASYEHLTPALFLSRQSVLSVFSTDAFDAWGLTGNYALAGWARLDGEGFVQRFAGDGFGYRLRVRTTVSSTSRFRPRAAIGYRRVREPDAGYHALTTSVAVSVVEPLELSAAGFAYLYDQPVDGVSASIVGAGSVRWAVTAPFAVALRGSLARSPYAELDAQAIARLEIDLEDLR